MLHELLMALWGCSTSLENIVETDSVLLDKYFHPGERGLVKRILEISSQYRCIQDFVKIYSSTKDVENANEAEPLPQGIYLQSFCDGVESALEPFRKTVVELEKTILQNAYTPATTILSRAENFQCLFAVMNSIIRRIKTQRLHGTRLLQCVHEYMHTGVPEIKTALQKILHCIHTVFYKQLTSWLLYGQLEDIHKEFFIRRTKNAHESFLISDGKNASGSKSKRGDDMWDYEVSPEMLPSYMTSTLANKILSIGQTIIIFGNDPRQDKDCKIKGEISANPVWGEKEHEYFGKLQSLQVRPVFNVIEFENTIDELKKCVTRLLWQVAVDDAQLLQQIKLIKDFYLIGRGDLFLDFVKLTSNVLNKPPASHTSRDVNLAFQMTMRRVMLNDENAADSFNFVLPSMKAQGEVASDAQGSQQKDREDPIDKLGWGMIVLQYRVVWPLQLLFSPKALNNYNTVFRFLLRVKKTQINLWSLWSEHTRTRNIDIGVLQFRNNLIFILDNLQYYLQVDVLESQYTVMENCIKHTENFEDVQRAHSVFLANIMSQTFLFGNSEEHSNPVNGLLRLLLRLCDDFILQVSMWEVTNLLSTEKEELKVLTDTLSSLMNVLIQTLNKVRSQPSGKHLAQLLLRLDFNRWFSQQIQ